MKEGLVKRTEIPRRGSKQRRAAKSVCGGVSGVLFAF
jgi:hypothetical protein